MPYGIQIRGPHQYRAQVRRNGVYGFPAARGGPMFHADTLGLDAVLTAIDDYRQRYHGEFWQAAPLLRDCAEHGRRLRQA